MPLDPDAPLEPRGPDLLSRWSDAQLITALAVTALAIRLYLALTSYCIAADGVEYVRMARDFAAGEPARAMKSVFSPLYPWLMSLLNRLVGDWETSGNLISVILGSASAPLVFLLMRCVFGRRTITLAAGALAA